MNNLLSYSALVDVKINAFDKDLPVFQVAPSLKQLLLDTVAISVVENQVEIKKIRKISAYLKVITFKVDFNIFLK